MTLSREELHLFFLDGKVCINLGLWPFYCKGLGFSCSVLLAKSLIPWGFHLLLAISTVSYDPRFEQDRHDCGNKAFVVLGCCFRKWTRQEFFTMKISRKTNRTNKRTQQNCWKRPHLKNPYYIYTQVITN